MPSAEIIRDLPDVIKIKALNCLKRQKQGKGKGRGMNVKIVAIVNDLFCGQWTVS
jgi:hypothetical protein